MPIDFAQIKNAANTEIAENQQREQRKEQQINKLNEYLHLKIDELLAKVDKIVPEQLKRVLGNENNCISEALKNALVEYNDFMKNTPKLKFYLEMYLPAIVFFLSNNIQYIGIEGRERYVKDVWTLKIHLNFSVKRIARSKQIGGEPIVIKPTELDIDWFGNTYDILKTKLKLRNKDSSRFSFEYCKPLDMEKYVDIMRDAFSELGFRSVEIKHTDPEWKDYKTYTEFEITVDNPLFEE